jgi:L-ascorbate metabolism protein UlaG (beta-lactamase superfamily)
MQQIQTEPVRLTFVGHSTVLIELDGVRVLTDPQLRGRFLHVERRAPPVDLAALGDIDLVLISHAHHDHLDRGSLRKLGPNATLVVPRGARRLVPRSWLGPVEEIVEGGKLTVGGLEIEATHADHRPGRIRHRGPAAVGYSIKGTKRVYFAGDTDIFPGMRDLGAGGLDAALVPIWGWGSRLGSGHLDPDSAAEALTLLEPRVAIPIHWGTFFAIKFRRFRYDALTEPAKAFVRAAAERAPQVDVRVLAPGQTTVISD